MGPRSPGAKETKAGSVPKEPLGKDPCVVGVGKRVTVRGIDGNETTYLITEQPGDPTAGKINEKSPWGKGLLDKRINTEVTIGAPEGKIRVQITAVEGCPENPSKN